MTTKPPRKRNAPIAVGQTLQALLEHLDPEGHFAVVRLIQAWPEIVGADIARRTEVASLKFHTAVVKVTSAMWIQELNLMRAQILTRLREKLGDDSVRELRFIRGALSRRPPSRPRPAPREVRRNIKLPELKDPKLRAAFESLIEAWGRSPR